MCAHPHDCKYAAYGGIIDRLDRVNGRVGSVIDPAPVVTQPASAEAETPTPAAEDNDLHPLFDDPSGHLVNQTADSLNLGEIY